MKPLHFILGLALAGCTTANKPTPSASISEEKTREVLQHHLDAFLANDLEATMADYTEESILMTPDSTFTGLDQIRGNFMGAFAVLPKDSTTLTIRMSVVSQDMAYIIWEAKAPKLSISFGTDTFIIQDGKIIRQTFAGVFN